MKKIMTTFLALVLIIAAFAVQASAEEKIVIRMAIATGMSEYYTLADNYEKANEGVIIEIEEYPTAEIQSLLMAKLAGGDCWDIFPTFPQQYAQLTESDYVVDLSDLEDIIMRYKSPEIVRNTRTKNGVIASLPAQYQYVPLYYNIAKLNDLGLAKPANWTEFLSVVKAAKEAGYTPIMIGGKVNWACLHLMNQIVSFEVLKDNPNWNAERYAGTTSFSETEGWVNTFDKLAELINTGAFSASAASTSDEQAMISFLNGESLMYFGGTWSLNGLLTSMSDDFELGAMLFASNDEGETACTSTTLAGDFSIWSGAKHIGAVKDWLRFTLSAEQNLIFNQTKGPSPFVDVEVPLHASLVEYEAQLAATGGNVAPWIQTEWFNGTPYPDPMIPMIQELLYPKLAKPSAEILREMDAAWNAAAKK